MTGYISGVSPVWIITKFCRGFRRKEGLDPRIQSSQYCAFHFIFIFIFYSAGDQIEGLARTGRVVYP